MEVIYGLDCVRNALRARLRPAIHRLMLYGDANPELLDLAKTANVPVQRCSRVEIERLVGGVSRPHQDVALQVAPHRLLPLERPLWGSRWLALDGLLDPQNLGAIARTAAFFAVDGILLPRHNSVGLTPVAVKTSAGAIELIADRFRHPPLGGGGLALALGQAAAQGWAVIGTSPSDVAQGNLEAGKPLDGNKSILVLGSEGGGLGEGVRAACSHWWTVSPPSALPVGLDSLNVSVAAGLLLQRQLASVQRHIL